MARDTFNFDDIDLREGGFYHSAGDAQGTLMVGWGRRGRNKWVQLSQPEIAAFLTHSPAMLRTDDPAVKQALAQLADALAGSRKLTMADVLDDDALSARFAELRGGGQSKDEALAALQAELAQARQKARPRAIPKTA